MDASEKQPLAPVHFAELIVPPDNVEVSLGVCLKHDSNQLLTQRFDLRQHLFSCGIRWSMFKHIINIRGLLSTLKNAADGSFVDGGDGANMRQDICRGPFSLFWSCAKGVVRDSSGCCQKLMMCLPQRFDKLLRRTTYGLTCQITANACNLFFACLLFSLRHGLFLSRLGFLHTWLFHIISRTYFLVFLVLFSSLDIYG